MASAEPPCKEECYEVFESPIFHRPEHPLQCGRHTDMPHDVASQCQATLSQYGSFSLGWVFLNSGGDIASEVNAESPGFSALLV